MCKRLLVLFLCTAFAQAQVLLELAGRVRDSAGKSVPGAIVRLVAQTGDTRTLRTDPAGAFAFRQLPPGRYALEVEAVGFLTFAETRVNLRSNQSLNVILAVAAPKAQVTVVGRRLNLEPDNNVSAVSLRAPDLRGLPDFPGDFAAALAALAGPSSLGLGGPQIFVNNLTRRRLPPKTSVREVHINQTPFSAQYDRPGFNRIDVFTRSGGPTLSGETYFGVTDAALNARNPFSRDDPPHQLRLFGASLGGPIVRERLFFSGAVERTEADSGSPIEATVIDGNFNRVPYRAVVDTPERRTTSALRLDQHIGQQNLLSLRYEGLQDHRDQHSRDRLALPGSRYRVSEREHGLQLRHTATISPEVMNEARLQYEVSRKTQILDTEAPTVEVPNAFTGGGAPEGSGLNDATRWEAQNNLVITRGGHGIRLGVRLRHGSLSDVTTEKFGGVYRFETGTGPSPDALDLPTAAAAQADAQVQLTPFERYRRTLMLLSAGVPAAEVRVLGGGASELTLAAGDTTSRIQQLDFGAFVHDDWRARPRLTISYGLRFETQTNLRRSRDLAPRLSIAWVPGGSDPQNAQLVVRAGWGLFYDRVNEDLLLESRRGTDGMQRLYRIQDPSLLDAFPALPVITQSSPEPQVVRHVAGDLRAPATMQSMVAIERQLPGRTTVSVSLTHARTWHAVRARVVRPPDQPNTSMYRLDSDARLSERRIGVDISQQTGNRVNWRASYVAGRSFGDSDGPESITYDPRLDYSRSSKDLRHNVTFTGAFALPRGVQLSPFIVASSGRPFNIYAAEKAPGEVTVPVRPAWAGAPDGQRALATRFGVFDLNPQPGQPLIPRNLGSGPAFLSVNMKVAKSFALARAAEESHPEKPAQPKQPARVTLSAQAVNLLNRVNPGPLEGDLRSPQFGQPTALAEGFNFGGGEPVANRRLELQLRVQF